MNGAGLTANLDVFRKKSRPGEKLPLRCQSMGPTLDDALREISAESCTQTRHPLPLRQVEH